MTAASCTFSRSRAISYGGAVFSDNVVDGGSSYTACSSAIGGGALYATVAVNVTASSFVQTSSLGDGGCVYSEGTVSLASDSFVSCTAPAGQGGAVLSGGSVVAASSNFSGSMSGQEGGAIFGSSAVSLSSCAFTSCTSGADGGAVNAAAVVDVGSSYAGTTSATRGGAVFTVSSFSCNGCTFRNTSAGTAGGAVFAAALTINGSDFLGTNSGNQGGAAYSSGSATVSYSRFVNTSSTSNGGALASAGILTLAMSTFQGCACRDPACAGGTVFASSASITGSTFTGCTAGALGGAVSLPPGGGLLTLSSCSFASCSAQSGGAVALAAGTAVTDSGSVFSSNTAVQSGGALALAPGATATLTGTSFSANSASGNVPPVSGGALAAVGASVTLAGCTFGNNSVSVSATCSTGATALGGALSCQSGCTATASGATVFSGNTAVSGGAIYLFGAGSSFSASSGVQFASNSATQGGALAAAAASGASFSGASFQANAAKGLGGASYLTGTPLSLSAVTASLNSAGSSGGVVASDSPVTIAGGCSFTANSCAAGGSVMYLVPPEGSAAPPAAPSCLVAAGGAGCSWSGNSASSYGPLYGGPITSAAVAVPSTLRSGSTLSAAVTLIDAYQQPVTAWVNSCSSCAAPTVALCSAPWADLAACPNVTGTVSMLYDRAGALFPAVAVYGNVGATYILQWRISAPSLPASIYVNSSITMQRCSAYEAFDGSVCACVPGAARGSSGACACQGGYVDPSSQGSACIACTAGSYASAGACVPCSDGYFSATPAVQLCTRCPLYSSSLGDYTGCACNPGYTSGSGGLDPVAGTCSACPANTYQPVGGQISIQCSTCPPNSVTPVGLTAATSIASCQCGLGYFTNPDGTCQLTPPGYYTNAVGMAAPIQCPVNQITPDSGGAAACSACPPFSASITLSQCACGLGYAGTLFGSQGTCSACPKNTYQPAAANVSTSCIPCPENSATPVGAVAVSSLSQCLCSPGFYARKPDGACMAAPPGSYTASPGQSNYTACGVNSVTLPGGGASACSSCPVGAVAINATQCVCAAGYSGSFLAAAQGSCSACPADFYQPLSTSVSTACLPCPANSQTADRIAGGTSRAACLCQAGFYTLADGSCRVTPPGYYTSSAGSVSPLPCGSNQVTPPGGQAAECTSCPTNSVAVSASQCACTAGNYGLLGAGVAGGNGTCTPCAPNSYQPAVTATAASCTLCPRSSSTSGFRGADSSSSCTCSAGTYFSSAAGASSSDAAGGGSYGGPGGGPGGGSGGSLAAPAFHCLQAPPGYYTAQSGALAPEACPSGTVSPVAGAMSCTVCPLNAYRVNATSCKCQAGYFGFVTGASGTCQACPANQYRAEDDHVGICKLCPSQSTSSVASTSLAGCVCGSNLYQVAEGSSFSCSTCSSGGICPGNGLMYTSAGFWRASANDTVFYTCAQGYCLQELVASSNATSTRRRRLFGSPVALPMPPPLPPPVPPPLPPPLSLPPPLPPPSPPSAVGSAAVRTGSNCREGHGGRVCAVCLPGYSFQGSFCSPCDPTLNYRNWPSWQSGLCAAIFCAFLLVTFVLVFLLPILPASEEAVLGLAARITVNPAV